MNQPRQGSEGLLMIITLPVICPILIEIHEVNDNLHFSTWDEISAKSKNESFIDEGGSKAPHYVKSMTRSRE